MTGGFFAILDDIAALLDDAAVMSKIAAKKTAGILGDDLAVNAEKATGFLASRELPVLWAITKGSFINKLIILPIAFLLSAYASWLIVPILLLGGIYLSYEGVEKIYHLFAHSSAKAPAAARVNDKSELLKIEKTKIKSAIITDFILSIEIVMISLGTVMEKQLLLQIIVVGLVAVLATIGVYGVVAILVRMDDTGFYLIALGKKMQGWLPLLFHATGSLLVASLPHVIRTLGIIGTIAMLLVGGGIFTHNLQVLHQAAGNFPSMLVNLVIGLTVGGVILGIRVVVKKIVS